jgi:hypothetical protein
MSDGRVTAHAFRVSHPTARMRAAALLGAALMVLALAVPAQAAKPTRGCSDGKALMTREAGWASYDKNGDTRLCVKDLPDSPGHLGTWVWNVVDNTSNH